MTPYYDSGGITIYHGDCREVLPELPPASAHLILTDPPFSVPIKYQDAGDDYPRSWGDLVVMEPFFAEVFREIRRVVKATGQVYVHCDDESYPVFFKVAYPLWPQSQLVIWFKPTGRRGRGWMHAHELILHLRTTTTVYSDGFRQDVVGVMPVRTLNRQHPAEKPGDLLTFLADGLPTLHALVVDPFAGSGSTLMAAKRLNNRAIGIEIEERYCEIAAKRLSQGVLFGAEVA